MSISFFKNSVLRPKSLLLRKQLFTLFSLPQRKTKPLKQGLQKSNLFCTGIQQNTEFFVVFSKKYKQRGFKIQGETYGASWNEKSLWASVRVWFDLKEEDIFPAMIAAHDIMTHWALIRICVDEKDQDITFSVEQFCDSMDEYRPFFSRDIFGWW